MRTSLITFLLTGLVATSAFAKPTPNKAQRTPSPDDSVQITMTAGKGRLGVAVIEISPELRVHLGAARDRGVLVNTVKPDSPAAKVGLRVGDIITDVDHEAIDSTMGVLSALSDRKKGETVLVVVRRDGQDVELRPTLEDDAGTTWHSTGPGKMPPAWAQAWFDDGMPSFSQYGLHDPRMKKRLEQLEQRLEQLERRKP